MQTKIGATIHITEIQLILNTYSCLQRDSDTKNITPVHNKTIGMIRSLELNIDIHKYNKEFRNKIKFCSP